MTPAKTQPRSKPSAYTPTDAVVVAGSSDSSVELDRVDIDDRALFVKLGSSAPSKTHGFLELRVWAQTFEDVQQHRMSLANRLRSGTIPEDVVADILSNAIATEKMVGLAMRRSFRRTAPALYKWSKDTPGIGEHLLARLLGTIGHPCIAIPHHWEGTGSDRVLVADEPFMRNVAKLWSYCGHGDPTRRRRAGMTAEDAALLGNPRAKMLIHLIAESTMKQVGGAVAYSTGDANNPTPDHATFDAPVESSLADSTRPPSPMDSVSYAKQPEPFPTDSTRPASSRPHASQSDLLAEDGLTEPAIPGIPPTSSSASVRVRRRSVYRDVYEMARIKYASREDWTPGHQHNASLRYVAKTILRDLWVVAYQDLEG